MKNIVILGSTGSIGVSSLKVIKANPEKYQVIALAAGKNIELLLEQVKEFQPKAIAVLEETTAMELKAQLSSTGKIEVFFGTEGFSRLVTIEGVDTVISAMTGAAGLLPTYSAIRAGKDIALANKETMVMAGSLIMAEAKKQGTSVLPIDSEHSAILQSLRGHPREDLKRMSLTASGGPFRDLPLVEMSKVKVCHAPGGQPDMERTLSIELNSVADHVGHGDFLGTCEFKNSGGRSRAAEELHRQPAPSTDAIPADHNAIFPSQQPVQARQGISEQPTTRTEQHRVQINRSREGRQR